MQYEYTQGNEFLTIKLKSELMLNFVQKYYCLISLSAIKIAGKIKHKWNLFYKLQLVLLLSIKVTYTIGRYNYLRRSKIIFQIDICTFVFFFL